MARQGRFFDETAVQRIISLLSSTDMSIADIAQRMSCSRSAVLAINRKRQIRSYAGQHNTWHISRGSTVKTEPETMDVGAQDDGN